MFINEDNLFFVTMLIKTSKKRENKKTNYTLEKKSFSCVNPWKTSKAFGK